MSNSRTTIRGRADHRVLELFEVRQILEPAALALATPTMTAADIAHLRDLLAQVHGTTSVDELVANDIVFHRYISERAGADAPVSGEPC